MVSLRFEIMAFQILRPRRQIFTGKKKLYANLHEGGRDDRCPWGIGLKEWKMGTKETNKQKLTTRYAIGFA